MLNGRYNMDLYNQIILRLSPSHIEKAIQITVIFIVSLLLIFVIQRAIGLFFSGLKEKSRLSSYRQRISTAEGLLDNVVMITILGIAFLIIMREVGLDVTPILTGAGILGLAISFGAQTIVKDLLAGFFIIIENQFNVGDKVKINDTKGEISKINLRTTVLIDQKENTIYIPNSEIKSVLVYKQS